MVARRRRKAIRLVAGADFPSDLAAPVVRYVGDPVNVTAATASSTAKEFPPGAKVVEFRCTDSIYVRFGGSNVADVSASNGKLIVGGEKIVLLPLLSDADPTDDSDNVPVTHFKVIRVGSADVAVQVEEVETEA